MEKEIYICNTSEAVRSSKAHSYTFYLDRIKELGGEFEKLEAICTDGNIRPPYPYQWRATTKIIKGDDDACEGIAGSPLEALRGLYEDFKARIEYVPDEDDLDA